MTDDIEHEVETLSIEFEQSVIDVEVPSPEGWTAKRVSPNSCSWESEDGEHVACHSHDEVKGWTFLNIDGEVVARGLTKWESATRLAEFIKADSSATDNEPSQEAEHNDRN